MLPKIFDLITGIMLVVGGVTLLCQLPGYRRRVEAGEFDRDKSRPSFKTLRRVAIGILIAGILMIIDWALNLF